MFIDHKQKQSEGMQSYNMKGEQVKTCGTLLYDTRENPAIVSILLNST